MERIVQANEDNRTIVVVEIMAGAAAIAAATATAAVAFPVTEPAGRVLILAVAVGAFAARCRNWLAAAITAITAASIFPTLMAPDAAAGDPTPWSFTPLFVFALLLGRGYRVLAGGSAQPDPDAGTDTDQAADRLSVLVRHNRLTAVHPSEWLKNF